VRKLGALLRLADALDADHRQKVVRLRAEVKAKRVRLLCEILGNGAPPVVPELYKADTFEAEFDRKVSLEVTRAAAPRRRAARSE
jgi:hypothetical protein